jgi:hypothetical protein
MPKTINGVDVQKAQLAVEWFRPHLEKSEVAIAAPGTGTGYWNGASSAIEHEGHIYLAYRTRQPIELGRGQGVVIAKSKDGIHFETIQVIDKTTMDAESLERPALVHTPNGKWRLYLSCATTGTKHWRVELLEADTPDSFDPATRQVAMPGDKNWAVKDPVISYYDNLWHCWATFHPLDIPNEEDRMVSRYATSPDGLTWTWATGNCLKPRPDMWDSRGARVTAIYGAEGFMLAFYDGRASAAENYEERTGVAVGTSPDTFVAIGDRPIGESVEHHGLRYCDIVPLASGGFRLYYEVATRDDAHELCTEVVAIS